MSLLQIFNIYNNSINNGVIMVNGWTDAPNAIATCISTRSINPRGAIVWRLFLIFRRFNHDYD